MIHFGGVNPKSKERQMSAQITYEHINQHDCNRKATKHGTFKLGSLRDQFLFTRLEHISANCTTIIKAFGDPTIKFTENEQPRTQVAWALLLRDPITETTHRTLIYNMKNDGNDPDWKHNTNWIIASESDLGFDLADMLILAVRDWPDQLEVLLNTPSEFRSTKNTVA